MQAVNVIIFGATGMVGQGVLRECLRATDVDLVVSIVRKATSVRNPKLREIVKANLFDYGGIEMELTGLDACFFCLGVSSSGMTEDSYTRVTYDLTLAAAQTLSRLDPAMTFVFVSGAGADASEKSGTMWARVKGKTENALRRLPFKALFVFRPGVIQPLHGIQSQTSAYRIFYGLTKPLLPVFRRLFPNFVLTTEVIGQAMLSAARSGRGRHVLGAADINALASGQWKPRD